MSTSPTRVLSAHDVSVVVDGVTVLSHVTCRLVGGSMVGICGPNGAGKSTLLRVLAGIQVASQGEVRLDDTPVRALASPARARQLGFLPQHTEAAWPLRVRELVALGRFPHIGESHATRARAVSTALTLLGLDPLADRLLDTLSGGERTRAHLGRLFAGEPAFILADEPTAALDPGARFDVLARLRARADAGAGVGVVLHDLALAARYCDTLVLLAAGRDVAIGPPAEVLDTARLAQVFNVAGVFDPDSGMLAGTRPLQ